MYYFTVNKGDILSGLKSISNNNENSLNGLYCYVQRVSNGRPCKYYFREFRRVPNFKNTGVNNSEKLTEEDIKSCIFNNFNSSLNKLGFGTNIYGDRMAQIVFSDDVDVTGLHDNLGRDLHELFLTVIKTNRGNNKWYLDKSYSDASIEYSHCFSQITSGLDLPWPYSDSENDGYDDYNVHKIHNIPSSFNKKPKFPKSVKSLPNGEKRNELLLTVDNYEINCSGETKVVQVDGKKSIEYTGVFLGDIVELDELNLEEFVLEDVQHRFNTMQREYTKDGEFSGMTVNEITTDDYDGKFDISKDNYLGNDTDYYANLAAEGYYYKAHYRIPIREFSSTVNEGQDIIVKFETIEHDGRNVSGTTDKNYYFQKGDNIIAYDKNKEKYVGTITNVTGNNFTEIEFVTNKTLDVDNVINFFKPNPIKPSTAYDFNDGSGVYKWRDIESFEYLRTDSELYDSVFTNGAHYLHQNINFFLRRQDPYGLYGLNPVNNSSFKYEYQLLEQSGKEKDITPAQHFIEGDIQLC